MKKIIISLVLIMLMSLSMYSQVSIGIRESQHAYASYTFKNKYAIKVEHSIYAEKFAYQYLRGYVEYKSNFGNLNYSISPFFGRTYNNNYWSTGALLDVDYTYRRIILHGIVNPLYDSTFGYTTCFLVGGSVAITGPLSIAADYTTIPRYRMSEKRVRGGLDFRFEKFTFRPMLSLPVSGNGKAKSIRVEFSFNYQF